MNLSGLGGGSAAKVKLVTVHGTGAGANEGTGESWWQLGSPFQVDLAKRLNLNPALVDIVPFHWDVGPNAENKRRQAGEALYELLKGYDAAGVEYHVIGHSHGGSVIYNTLLHSVAKKKPLTGLKSWTSVGTPFLDYRPNRFLFSRLGHTGLTLYSVALGVLLFAAAALASYFLGTGAAYTAARSANVFSNFLLPFTSLAIVFSLSCMAFLYLIERYRSGSHPASRRKKVAELYKDRWIGLWHAEDEAIAALANVKHVSAEIILPDFLKPIVSILPVLLTVAGGLAIAYNYAGPFMDWVASVAPTVAADKAASPSGDSTGTLWVILYFAGILGVITAIYMIIARSIVAVMNVLAYLVGYPLSKAINSLIWSTVRQQAWGDDRGNESVHGIGTHPPEFAETFLALPKPVADQVSEHCNNNAIQTLAKVRELLGMTRRPKKSPDLRAQLSEQLTWQELIHTTYFNGPSFVNLIAYSLHRAGLADLKADFWKADSRADAQGWFEAISTLTPGQPGNTSFIPPVTPPKPNPAPPVKPVTPVKPVVPPTSTPTPTPPITTATPVSPVTPPDPTPVTPFLPVKPVTPVIPIVPPTPTPSPPITTATPVTPVAPSGPTPKPPITTPTPPNTTATPVTPPTPTPVPPVTVPPPGIGGTSGFSGATTPLGLGPQDNTQGGSDAQVKTPGATGTGTSEAKEASLDPVTPAVALSAAVLAHVKSADEMLSVDKINTRSAQTWNPFLNGGGANYAPLINPKLVDGKPTGGAYEKPNEVFDAKVVIPVQTILGGYVASQPGPVKAALNPLVNALAPAALLRRPSHKFNIDGKLDTRVVLFGGKEAGDPKEKYIAEIIHELGKKHLRVIAQWAYPADYSLSQSTQGGTPADILGNTYMPAGSSHINLYSTGFIDGKPVVVNSNWGDDSHIDDMWPQHAVHLLAIDYQAGVEDPVPDESLAAWKHNADMWDCFASMLVPFASSDQFGYTKYSWNPLEVHDQESALAVAAELANLDWQTFSKKYGAFYCAEAQYSISNWGPQEATLLKESLFGNTRVGQIIRTFGNAPGFAGKDIEWKRFHPEIGWKWLTECGKDKGGISLEEYAHLAFPKPTAADKVFSANTYSNRQGIYLEFVPEPIKGWQSYRPRNRDGLIASPLSTATTAWSLVRAYLPIEKIAETIVSEVMRAYQSGGPDVKQAVWGLASGADPMSAEGKQALSQVARALSGGMLVHALNDDSELDSEFKRDPETNQPTDDKSKWKYVSSAQKSMFENAGYQELTKQEDKDAVKKLWDEFLSVIQNPENASQEKLDAAFLKADKHAKALRVERDPAECGRTNAPKYTSLMCFVPPGCWAMWAQQPFYSEAYAVRYVATAVHKSIAKEGVV